GEHTWGLSMSAVRVRSIAPPVKLGGDHWPPSGFRFLGCWRPGVQRLRTEETVVGRRMLDGIIGDLD
ncbi:hypothetical protein, partial [Mycobacterium avium]|uniref:hypothetical protein n=1 Tax=Mycobacterium avium TaxID=1764 RepID=UPI001E3C5105